MIARPKRYLGGGLRTVNGRDTFWVECEIIDPPSQKGRSIDLLLAAEDVTDLLVELRSAAIEARR